MVLSKAELIGLLQNEVRILQHLITKIEPSMVDYRPTPKQRSTIELLRYLTVMGPVVVKSALAGAFDVNEWTTRQTASAHYSLEQARAALASQADEYVKLLGHVPDEAFRKPIELFGNKGSAGALIVSIVLSGCAAYRTQVFLYLKACGREELGTMNLWAGMDAPPAAN